VRFAVAKVPEPDAEDFSEQNGKAKKIGVLKELLLADCG
tara:strand:- start:1993 stop:2109 length:117 start_codon:yes stop_codon:yes gene_type:complete